MSRRFTVIALLVLSAGCGDSTTNNSTITLAAGTTLQDSGLFDALLPRCRAETGIEVKAVAVGTGQALEIAKRGDADALLTHSPSAEKEFLAAGWAESRVEVFWNDFVFVGPQSDPAAIKQAKDAQGALRRIAEARAPFVSRGDDSGNHKLELKLWQDTGLKPAGDWYISVGAGMAQAFRVANEKQAYLLADRGTWLASRKQLELAILHEGDPKLINQYSVLVVSPARHPHLNTAAARQFAQWLRKPQTEKFIADFGKDKYGEALFKIGSASPPGGGG